MASAFSCFFFAGLALLPVGLSWVGGQMYFDDLFMYDTVFFSFLMSFFCPFEKRWLRFFSNMDI